MREQIGKTGQERCKKRHLRLRAHLSDCMKSRVSDDRLRTVEVGTCITGTRAHGAVNDEIELLLAGACLAQLRIQVQSIHAHLHVPYSSESQRTPRTNHRLRNVHASFSSNEYDKFSWLPSKLSRAAWNDQPPSYHTCQDGF